MRFILTALLVTASLFAAEHKGIVTFAGLPVPGVAAIATQGEKKVSAVTGPDGVYSFPDLADGQWNIRVEMLCFTPISRDMTVGPGAPRSEWELKLQSFDEIKANAPAPPPEPPPSAVSVAPTTTSSATQAAAKGQQVANKGKKPAKNAPSAAPAESGFKRADVSASNAQPPAAENGTPPAPGEASNQSSADSFAINGSANNAAASPFGLSGAFGNNRRGPGSLYNGNVGVVLGNAILDARQYSLTGQDTPKPAYNHLTFSGSVGGPLRIPHIYRGGNSPIAFFVAYQMVRNRNASTIPALVPTQDERNGILSTGTIPQSLISPQAKALLKFYPLPNFTANARYNYQTALTGTTHQDSVQSRLSKNLGRTDQVFGTLGYQNTRGMNTSIFSFDDGTSSVGVDLTLNWSHRFSQRLFSTYKFQFNRLASRSTPFFTGKENISGEAGITGNNQDPLNWGPPSLNFSNGIASLSDANQSYNRFQTTALSASIYWSHSPHNVTFGGDYKRQQFNYLGQQDPRGIFTFTGAATGSVFGDFLTGVPDTSAIAFGNADKYFRSSVYDAYITDDWRVNPSFTINGGARWEYTAPIVEKYGRLVNLDVTPGYANAAPVTAIRGVGPLSTQLYPDSLVKPDKHGLQPRIGISWRPISGSSLVVRSGYAMNFDTSVYQSIAVRMAQQSPLSKSLSVQNTPSNPLTLASGFNAAPNITTNTFAVDPKFRIGYAQTWQLQVQRDLPGSLVMTATYLGIKGTRGQQSFLPNTYPTGALNPCPLCDSGYVYLTSNGNSTKQTGQFQLRRRLHNGITAQVQYTYSKAIDDAALGGRGQSGSVIAQNWLNLRGERGLSPFDQRHVVTFQSQYSTGAGIKGGALMSGWRGVAFKDWTVTSVVNAGTGTPLTPVYGPGVVSGTGVSGSIRPDYTGIDVYSAPPGFYLNPAAYTKPASGQWGNAGRDSITGPNQFTLAGSMARTFQLHDRMNMDLRIDAANAINHVTFPNWNTTVTSGQFGLPSQANPMRSVTVTMRVRF